MALHAACSRTAAGLFFLGHGLALLWLGNWTTRHPEQKPYCRQKSKVEAHRITSLVVESVAQPYSKAIASQTIPEKISIMATQKTATTVLRPRNRFHLTDVW